MMNLLLKNCGKNRNWIMEMRSLCKLLFVIRLGLEPKTPTLKVLCSTC